MRVFNGGLACSLELDTKLGAIATLGCDFELDLAPLELDFFRNRSLNVLGSFLGRKPSLKAARVSELLSVKQAI